MSPSPTDRVDLPEQCLLDEDEWLVRARRALAHQVRSQQPQPYFGLVRDERPWGAVGWDPLTCQPAAIFLTPTIRSRPAHLPSAKRQAILCLVSLGALAVPTGILLVAVLAPAWVFLPAVLALVFAGLLLLAIDHRRGERCVRLPTGTREAWGARIGVLDAACAGGAAASLEVRQALWDWQAAGARGPLDIPEPPVAETDAA